VRSVGAGALGVGIVTFWRRTLGLLTPPRTCKFHPSCSQYAIDAFRELGLARGAVVASWRLLRCHPWSPGGVDHVRDRRVFRGTTTRGRM
jgi:putative membrane protein insertion efficiency factor